MPSLIPILTLILTSISNAQFHPNPFGSSTSNSTTYDVDVGKSGLTFEPSTIHASIGDVINFHFWPSNHSVAESTFDNPCQPKSGGVGVQPIFSGFIPSKQGSSDTMFSMIVNSSDPIWLYCSQTEMDHCRNGQVMVINPLANNAQTLQAYVNASRASSNTTSPQNVFGGVLKRNNAASPNVTATGVDVAIPIQTNKSAGVWFGPDMWFALGMGTIFVAAIC